MIGMSRAFKLAAAICFALAAFGVGLPVVALVPLGLLLFTVGELV